MDVIPAMAAMAGGRQNDSCDILRPVAGVAIQAFVFSRQRVFALSVMIEEPSHPSIRVVTKRAIGSEPTFVVLILVALRASSRRIFERRRAVAFLARHDGMATKQRKSGDVVIEMERLTPAGFLVALLATAAELGLVGIVLSVTSEAVGGELFAIEIARMAVVALDLDVTASEGILRLIVLEMDGLPFVLVVAGLTFCSVPIRVNVL
jgi:hypothetical protein